MPSWKRVFSVPVTPNNPVEDEFVSIDYVEKVKDSDSTVRVYIKFDKKYQDTEEVYVQVSKVINALPKNSIFHVRRKDEKDYSITADVSLIEVLNIKKMSNVLLVRYVEDAELKNTTEL